MFCRTVYSILFLCVILPAFSAFGADAGDPPAIEAKTAQALRQMSEYLNTFKQFTFHAENSVDTLLSSGQKVQLGRAVDVFVWRPDRFRANIKGDVFDQELFYDGKSITLFGKKVNSYATMEAPSNIEAAMDHAMDSFGLVAPLADLMYRNSYDILTEDVQSGGYVGLSTVLGVECHHLAFRAEETDWQIWIENSKTPLPRKFVITSKWIAGAPQFSALLTNWDISAQLKDSLFTFVAPGGAEKIEFLPTENR
jgi:hypothetical protein